MADRNLIKVMIHSFPNRDFSGKEIVFNIPVNPETYSQNFKIELDKRKGHGNSSTDPRFKSTEPEELKLDFVLDGTNTIEGYDKSLADLTVKEQLQKFEQCVYDYDGSIHRPRFLKVMWGDSLIFPCVLSNLTENFVLFNPNGSPLRVKISATFFNYEAQLAREARERNKSPNLTHLKLVTPSDRLDLLTYEIYNDPNYYLQVGKVNGLTSVRNVKSGVRLSFPPFDKNQT